uniref:Reverse transcriptase domain-containing protein n=1 Tax=Tanacetum cinerariifolium TaxID=118510 RepID=A0A6L2N831_TANCI|nr:reverse transcriptase domain-containing protein [Tanacetum cinerariifolium]
MALTFADTHNMIAFLTKSDASEAFEQIIDFLNTSVIQYALMVNLTIYVSCIKQFWSFVSLKKTNNVVRLQALIDRRKVIITEDTLMINAQITDLSSHNTKYTSFALIQKVFANIRRVGKGFSRVDTLLFDGMLVPQQVQDDVDATVKDEDVAEPTPPLRTPATTPPPQQELIPSPSQVESTLPPSPHQSPIAQSSSPPPQQPSQHEDISHSAMALLNQLLDTYATQTNKVGTLEQDKIAQAIEITMLKQRARRLEKKRKLKALGFKILRKVGTRQRVESSADTTVDAEDADVQGRLPESQAQVVTTAATTITTALMPKANAPRRRRGVIIQDPEEAATASLSVKSENEVIKQVKRKEKQDNTVMRYQALRRKLITKAQARKNIMVYLKNMAGFKMDFFKEKEIEEEESKENKRKSESSEQKAAKKQRIDEEVKELKRHLQIIPNDEDDVYTEATPLALKVPIVDYEIHIENNKPYYKIIRADGTHQLFLNFISLLRNFDREDLEMLWKIVQERFESLNLKNFSADILLNTLKNMFEKPNVEANIWKNQRGKYGLAKVKSWKLLESCGVHISTFTTTQMILLVERRYHLTRFTLEQMLNNVRLEVEEDSEERMRLCLFQFSLHDQGRTAKLKNDILMVQQHQGIESNVVVDKNIVEPIELVDKEEAMDEEMDNDYNRRIAEDILIDVVSFVYPMDFIILDIKEDECMPVILGTQFLTTTKAKIKVSKGIMTIRAGNCKIGFISTLENPSKIEERIKGVLALQPRWENDPGKLGAAPDSVRRRLWLDSKNWVTDRTPSNLPVVSFNPSTSKRRNRRPSKQPFILKESPCLAAGGNTFPELRDNIQGYVSAAAVNYNQGNSVYRPPEQSYQASTQQNQIVPLNELEKVKRMNEANMKAMQTQINMVKNELRNEMKNSIQASLSNQSNEIKNMMASLLQMNTASTSGSGSLPSNTAANPKDELKAITTRSGLVIDGPTVPTPPPFINPKEDERVEETLTDPDLSEYTIKYQKMLKALLSNKEKLQELANIPLNENCSAVILKKLLEKLGDPRKFLILCGFSELKCKALANLGASFNLMPLSVWKKLGLPELISTRMTLELANRAICTPTGIARDVFVPVGKFTFPPDFVIVDYESDPRVPLILGRPFLRTARALIDVHDSSLKDLIGQSNLADNFVDSKPEMFTDEHALDYSSPLIFDEYDDDFLEFESNVENVYDDHFDSNGEKIKDSKLLIDELDLPCNFLPSEYDSFISQDFSRVDAKPSTNNENKDFDPPFYEPLFFKEVPRSKMLLPFSSENAEKFSNQAFTLLKKLILLDTHILAVPCLYFYPLDQFKYGGIRSS